MDPREEKIYNLRIKITEALFRPIIKALTFLGLNADILSYLGPVLMVIFIFVLPQHVMLGFWLVIGRMLADLIDGPLARHQKTDSDRGKFVDVMMDNLAFALFIFGVVRAGLLTGLNGSIYLFATELVVILMIIRYNFKHKNSSWFFFASAGSFPYNLIYLSYLLYAVYAFNGNDYLNGAAQIFIVLLGLKAAKDYWIIQQTKKT